MTEKELGNCFLNFLNRQQDHKFDFFFEEVETFQGIPDFIGVKCSQLFIENDFKEKISMNRWINLFKILIILNEKNFHSTQYIASKSGISLNTINKEILYLEKNEYLEKNKYGSYKLKKKILFPNTIIFSFELKLDDWKRALFQALRYKFFSDYTYILMPKRKEKILKSNLKIFKENNIGILLYDEAKNDIQFLLKARKNVNLSKMHKIDMIGRLMYEINDKKDISNTIKIVN